MKICFSLLSILFTWVSASALSLGPYTEKIIVKGDTLQLVISNKYDPVCMLDTARLDAIDKAYLEVTNGMIILVEDTPRVYACSWEIRNNALFLVRITTHGHNRMGGKPSPWIVSSINGQRTEKFLPTGFPERSLSVRESSLCWNIVMTSSYA